MVLDFRTSAFGLGLDGACSLSALPSWSCVSYSASISNDSPVIPFSLHCSHFSLFLFLIFLLSLHSHFFSFLSCLSCHLDFFYFFLYFIFPCSWFLVCVCLLFFFSLLFSLLVFLSTLDSSGDYTKISDSFRNCV